MQSIADGLPTDVAQQVHPDWRKNEAEYWAVRDSLLTQYADQWIAFAEGAIIASGVTPVEIFHQAQKLGKHPYVTHNLLTKQSGRTYKQSFGRCFILN